VESARTSSAEIVEHSANVDHVLECDDGRTQGPVSRCVGAKHYRPCGVRHAWRNPERGNDVFQRRLWRELVQLETKAEMKRHADRECRSCRVARYQKRLDTAHRCRRGVGAVHDVPNKLEGPRSVLGRVVRLPVWLTVLPKNLWIGPSSNREMSMTETMRHASKHPLRHTRVTKKSQLDARTINRRRASVLNPPPKYHACFINPPRALRP
jgi:hypothetical protein